MRPCSRSGCRRLWGSWLGLRRRGCWRLASSVGLGVLRELLEEEVDQAWSARRASGTRSGRRSVTATRTGR